MREYWSFMVVVLLLVFSTQTAYSQAEEIDTVEIHLGEDMYDAYLKKDDKRKMIVKYRTPQITHDKDIFVELLLNNNKVEPTLTCGNIGRLESRSDTLTIEVDWRELGNITELGLRISKIYSLKPPAQKWALGSLLKPNWGHNQIDKSLGIPPKKRKKTIVTPIIVGLLSTALLSEMTSRANYRTADININNGDFETYTQYYNQANNWRRTAVVLTGAAIVLDIGNAISIYRKGKKQLKNYKKRYPNGNKCPDF